jgi:multiple antibiotic resistance protein
MSDYVTSALATLLVVADPLFLSAIFLGLTHDLSPEQRKEVALRGTIIAFCILLVAGLGGAKLLDLLGISLSAFRIAGGLLLLSSAAEMVFDRRGQRQQDIAQKAISVDHVRNIAAFPLAIPLMAGPGAITAMILLAGRAEGDYAKLGALYAIAGLVMALCYVAFRVAVPISRTLGITGRAVVSRLLGIVLAALAVQFVIDGVVVLARS